MGRLHLGTILGTTIAVDFSFVIVIFFFVFTSDYAMPTALLWAPVLFISILFHEFAHAATIGLLGHGSSEIVLEGFGGVTLNARRSKPWQDLLISAAGPLASFLLAFLVTLLGNHVAYLGRDRFFRELIPFLQWANVVWGFFNLLPVIPLDGSSVVRNFLRMFLRESTAFVISIWLSLVTAAVVIVYALMIRQWFLAAFLAWYGWMSWQRWEFYRHTNRTDE